MPKGNSITEATIKEAAKQYDLAVVFRLSMKGMGLRRIENLNLVPSLTELDLSSNNIARMEGLEPLESLKRLVLANNQIGRLEGVGSLDALETLQLQGNRISNLDDVQCLTPLPCLRHLQLQVRDGEGGEADRNPMCDNPAYRSAVRRMLPSLQTLDGERTALADVAMPPSTADALANLKFAEPEPWLKDFSWESESALGPLDGNQEFEQVLTECKRLSAKAGSLVDDYNARTPRAPSR